jgi:GT2 family glycosyltransferase
MSTAAAPRVSVVIPSWNGRRWIGATIDSVLRQTLPAHEVIVVDDGSIDGTAEYLQGAYPSVQVVRQANAGVSAARNRGVACATGEWVAFLDADDIWLPDKLQQQWALLLQQPEAELVCSGWLSWTCSDPTPPAALLEALASERDDPERWGGPTGWIYGDLLLACCVWTSTVVMHQALLARTGGFDTGLSIGEDLDLWLRASRLTPIARVPRPLALYRQHGANTTRRAPAVNHQAMVVKRAVARWGLASPDGRITPQREVDAALAKTWRDFAGGNMQAGHWQRARSGAREALRLDRLNTAGWRLLLRTLLEAARPDPDPPR